MPDNKTYTGSCHCGAVRYEVTTEISGALECNCSMCGRKGWLLAFVGADQFRLVQGKETLTDYQFNKKVTHHVFCKVCGVSSFSYGTGQDGKQSYAINLRCLDGVDAWSLPVERYEGKHV